jgi:hypothetical protein
MHFTSKLNVKELNNYSHVERMNNFNVCGLTRVIIVVHSIRVSSDTILTKIIALFHSIFNERV